MDLTGVGLWHIYQRKSYFITCGGILAERDDSHFPIFPVWTEVFRFVIDFVILEVEVYLDLVYLADFILQHCDNGGNQQNKLQLKLAGFPQKSEGRLFLVDFVYIL